MTRVSQHARAAAKQWPVVVVGAGLAGLACAIRLAQRGVPVRVLETRQRPGGRATSHVDPRGGLIDNCQHVTMGCCHRYLALCDTLGVRDAFAWSRTQTWIEPGGRRSRISIAPLPAPLHFGPSFARASFLSLSAKASIARAMAAISLAPWQDWVGRTFSAFLDHAQQEEDERTLFWSPVIVSACNLSIERVDASLALRVFREGFLASRRAALIGVPRVPLANLYDAAAEIIASAGGELSLSTSVARIHEDRVECVSGEVVRGRAIVVALPPERCDALVDASARDERFACFAHLTHSPILGVHLWTDRVVLDTPHAVLVDDGLDHRVGVQWLFAKHTRGDAATTSSARADEAPQALHAVVSAADEWMEMTDSDIAARVRADLSACLGGDAGNAVQRVIAIKERRATFAATPTFERLRPHATGSGSLVLAGDYTATGWPATMEGAVRSGETAALGAMARLSR